MEKLFDFDGSEAMDVERAFSWMKEECENGGGEILESSIYKTISDYYIPFDYHMSYFYDQNTDELYVRTYYYSTGFVTYEKLTNANDLVGESDETRIIALVLIRTGVQLSNA